MFVVDTNILIYAAIEESDEHEIAYKAVSSWRTASESWFITWPIAYEFLRVTTHRSLFDRPLRTTEAWQFVQTLVHTPDFGLLAEPSLHRDILSELVVEHPRLSGDIIHDLHTAAIIKESG